MKLPIVKASFPQGLLFAEYLQLVGEHQIAAVSTTRREFQPIVINDLMRRYVEADAAEKCKVLTDDPKVAEKRFDSEYCRLRDFCEDFHLTSQQDPEVMLTFFGRMVVDHLKKADQRDLFSEELRDLLGRVVIFVDAVDHWSVIDALKELGGTTTTKGLAEALFAKGVGVDEKGIESRIKPKLMESYYKEWREARKPGTPDFYAIRKRLSQDLRTRVVAESQRVLIDLLRVYKHVGLVQMEKNSVALDEARVQSLQKTKFWKTSTSVSAEDFRRAFTGTTKKHSGTRKSAVPIAFIRDEVCQGLEIPWETFDLLARKLATSKGNEAFNFSQGRFQRKWGLVVNRTPYYYVALRRASTTGR